MDSYPDHVPQVVCLDNIYHPNIDPSELHNSESESDADDSSMNGNVCVSLLDEWESSMDLDHIVMAILFLMYNPCVEDPLSPYFDGSEGEGDVFEGYVRKTLRGEPLEGINWPRLLVNDEDVCDIDNSGNGDSDNGASKAAGDPDTADTDSSIDADAAVRLESNVGPSAEVDEDSENVPSAACDEHAITPSNKEGDDSAVILSKVEATFNRQNSAVTDVTTLSPKGIPASVIGGDGCDLDGKTYTGTSQTVGSCLGVGINALFSSFWGKDGTLQACGCGLPVVVNQEVGDVD